MHGRALVSLFITTFVIHGYGHAATGLLRAAAPNQIAPGLGEYVNFPRAGVRLRQPEGFEPADAFEGFGQHSTQSSIMVTSLEESYAACAEGFTKEELEGRGWTLRSRQDVSIEERPALLIHFEQPTARGVYLKWILVFGDDQRTTLVTAAFPKQTERELSDRMKAAVQSTRFVGVVAAEPEGAFPLTVIASPKLKLTPATSNALLYTKDGVVPLKSPKDPMLVVARGGLKGLPNDKRVFALERLQKTAQVRDLVAKSTEAVAIDGLEGYETHAEATDAASGTRLMVFQVMLFDESAYILIQGMVGVELHGEYVSEFKTMARSLRRTRR